MSNRYQVWPLLIVGGILLSVIWFSTYPHGRGQQEDDEWEDILKKLTQGISSSKLTLSDKDFINNFNFESGTYKGRKPSKNVLSRLRGIWKGLSSEILSDEQD